MKTIENKVKVGAIRSLARYKNAHRICADCLDASKSVLGDTQKPCGDWIPRQDAPYKALAIGNRFASYDGVCYVCEKPAHVAVVEFIPARDADREGAIGMCAELGGMSLIKLSQPCNYIYRGREVFVKSTEIITITRSEDGTLVHLRDGRTYTVTQTPEEITLLVNQSTTTPDYRRIQCEAIALKIYEQLDRINSEAQYAGQVQQIEEAVTGEWCIQVANIIQKELEWK